MFRIVGDTNIDFIGKRKFSFIFSGALVALGLFAMLMISLDRANMGIDFVGGTMIQGVFEKPVPIEALRGVVAGAGFAGSSIQELTDRDKPNSFLIRIKETEDIDGLSAAKSLEKAIASGFTDNAFRKDSEHTIGPAVGKSLRKDAFWAIIGSVIGILIYIAIRFDFRGGVAATIATFHDVLAVLGIFYLLDIEITLLIVTALLTVAGYSLTDTVVIYDRIRENLRKFRRKAEFVPAINRSINETLARTLNTSLTVLFVVVVLFFFGGEVLHDFSLALILGVFVGTYSSMFVASPIIAVWEAAYPKRFK
ncbi:MAG: protein translocase subunit SecF [candidate division Zixibacteria bacterium]|nr:protein translocase subunit SecF [candidate division Zixibacteria bacterium]